MRYGGYDGSYGGFGPRFSNLSLTGGSITGTNVADTISSTGIPFIKLSSGTMGNNGALSAITALARTYSNGAYVWLPAGAIAAGVPAAAAWYWCIFSSTTAGTVYNSTYTSGMPVIGTQTAFATTGPGAFTGDTGEVAFRTISIAAGSIGANGTITMEGSYSSNNAATAKSIKTKINTTFFLNLSRTSETGGYFFSSISNCGSASVQIGGGGLLASGGAAGQAPAAGAVDTTAAVNAIVAGQTAAATDNLVLENCVIRRTYVA